MKITSFSHHAAPGRRPRIIAHRGASGEFPENTASAFDGALGKDIHGIETDIQLSKDGIPVLFHDRDFSKIGREGRRIADMTLRELRDMDMGSWFHPRFKGERIMTLEEFLRRYGGKTSLFLEIKARTGGADTRHDELAEKTVETICRMNPSRGTAILSFNPKVLQTVHRISPSLPTVLNINHAPGRLSDRFGKETAYLAAFCVSITSLSRSFVTDAHERGKQVFTFRCNTKERITRALEAGVDAIISSPDWAVGIFQDQ